MKRFTETNKWRDPWFRRLSPEAKLFWSWLDDNCDAAGVIDLDYELASFDVGRSITETHLAELGDRIVRLPSGKHFIPKFIAFQYGRLSHDCRAHEKVFDAIDHHGLGPVLNGATITLEKKPTGGDYHKDSRTVLHLLNEASGKHFRETDTNLSFISARLSEPGVDLGGVGKMIERQCRRWKGTEQAEYLRPETLFNKTKFDGYYAARNQPVESGKPAAKFTPPNPFNEHIDVPSL